MKKIIDLSMEIHEGMQTFAAHWHPFVEITQLGRHGIENRETKKITLGTHTGTHIDAPLHFIPGGLTIEKLSLELMNGMATVLDFSDLEDFTEIHLELFLDRLADRPCERVIIRYDWDLRLGTNEYFSDHPFLSEEVCRWLVTHGCKLIALDAPQPDNPKNGRHSKKDAPNHHILLGSGVLIVEYLVNIRALESDRVFLIVAPLKIRGGDGAPLRCFAFDEVD